MISFYEHFKCWMLLAFSISKMEKSDIKRILSLNIHFQIFIAD